MESLRLRVTHQPPEVRDEPSPTGFVWVERGPQRAGLYVPDEIEPGRQYPLVTVLHGAGRQDEMLMKAYRDEADRRDALFLVPRSHHPTWDLIVEGGYGGLPPVAEPEVDAARPDLAFLEYAYDLIYRRYAIDRDRQAIVGYSDGASYGLSLALSNPEIYRAAMCWAAGFLAVDSRHPPAEDARKPHLLLEYGTHDELFPFEQVAVPMREQLREMGYPLEFRIDQGGRHWPSGEFQEAALDWFFSEPWQDRS